jgi:single-strand DNA-binding protein
MNLNRVQIAGNLTRDPELRYTANGTPVCNAGMAINRRVKVGDQWKEEVDFIGLTIWGKRGEAFAQNLKKGRCVYCEGRISAETYEHNGKKETKTKVVVEEWQFVGGPPQGQSTDRPAPTPRPSTPRPQAEPTQPELPAGEAPTDDDDVPF